MDDGRAWCSYHSAWHSDTVDKAMQETSRYLNKELKKITEPKKRTVYPEVVKDLLERVEMGREKYGAPLTTNNGRPALQDAYEEALDLAMYLKQRIMEEEWK